MLEVEPNPRLVASGRRASARNAPIARQFLQRLLLSASCARSTPVGGERGYDRAACRAKAGRGSWGAAAGHGKRPSRDGLFAAAEELRRLRGSCASRLWIRSDDNRVRDGNDLVHGQVGQRGVLTDRLGAGRVVDADGPD